MADPTDSRHLNAGDTIAPHQLQAISGESVSIPDPDPAKLTHLELRRFAGCPVCNLHLRSVVMRKDELAGGGHPRGGRVPFDPRGPAQVPAELPFDVIADPDKKLYGEFGVESAPRAMLSPRAWGAIIRGLGRSIGAMFRRKEAAPPVKPGGRLASGSPATS